VHLRCPGRGEARVIADRLRFQPLLDRAVGIAPAKSVARD